MKLINTIYLCTLENEDKQLIWYFFDLDEKKLYGINSDKKEEISERIESTNIIARFFAYWKRLGYLGYLVFRSMKEFFDALPRDADSLHKYLIIELLIVFLVISSLHNLAVLSMSEIKKNSEDIITSYKQIREYYKVGKKARTIVFLLDFLLLCWAYYSISRFFMKGRMDWIYEMPLLILILFLCNEDNLSYNRLRFFLYLWKEARKEKK